MKFEKWASPMADWRNLEIEKVVYDGQLCVTCSGNVPGLRMEIRFKAFAAYRLLDEAFLVDMLASRDEQGFGECRTVKVKGSPFESDLAEQSPIFGSHYPDVRNFLIVSDNEVVEVLSDREPEMVSLA